MRVHRLGQRLGGRAHLQSHCGLVDQVRRVRSDQMDADDAARLRVGDDLHQPGGLTGDVGLAEPDRPKLADLDPSPCSLASCSVSPTRPISGKVKMPAGITSYRMVAGWPRMLRTATFPCAEATCASSAFPTTSPIA